MIMKGINGFGYIPTREDHNLLARALFAEGRNTPEDMEALAYAIINRIRPLNSPREGRELGHALEEVLSVPPQFSFWPNPSQPEGSASWILSAHPERMNHADRGSWNTAVKVVERAFGNAYKDPTGHASFFFASPRYDGNWRTAPDRFYQEALRTERLRESPYDTPYPPGPTTRVNLGRTTSSGIATTCLTSYLLDQEEHSRNGVGWPGTVVMIQFKPVALHLTIAAAAALPLVFADPVHSNASGRVPVLGSGGEEAGARERRDPVFPVTSVRFDMVCQVEGRVLGNPFPEQLRSSPAPTADPWSGSLRESVDLRRMESCGPWCRSSPPTPVQRADDERITFIDISGVIAWLRRSDGRYYHRVQTGDRIDETRGYCSRADFTDFPQRRGAAGVPKV